MIFWYSSVHIARENSFHIHYLKMKKMLFQPTFSTLRVKFVSSSQRSAAIFGEGSLASLGATRGSTRKSTSMNSRILPPEVENSRKWPRLRSRETSSRTLLNNSISPASRVVVCGWVYDYSVLASAWK